LPLTTTQAYTIAVIGSAAHAHPIAVGEGSGRVEPPYVVTPLQGVITRTLGTSVTVLDVQGDSTLGPIPSGALRTPTGTLGLLGEYFDNPTLSGTLVLTRVDPNVDFTWWGGPPGPGVPAENWSARWTGSLVPTTTGTATLALTSDDGSRLFISDTLVIDNWGEHGDQTRWATIPLTAGQAYPIRVEYFQASGDSDIHFQWCPPSDIESAVAAASQADVAVVVVGLTSGEGWDRTDLFLPCNQDALISAVAQANPHTIVVLYTPAQVLLPWADQVAAILVGWLPGQEAGNALADVLFGDVNPSGRLPVTFARNAADYPAAESPEQYPGVDGRVFYSEGLRVGYRHFDSRDITPLFPFGHGLSYTTFEYGNLSINPTTISTAGMVTVTLAVTNTGSRAGAEVVQFYLGFPPEAGEPPRQLKGLQKIYLQPGETQPVTFTLTPEAFSFWSAGLERWVAYPGAYQVMVGASSRDIRLNGSFVVQGGPLAGTVYEAENAVLSGGTKVSNDHTGYTGSGFVDGYWNVGTTTTFHVNVDRSGECAVTLRYANGWRPPDRNVPQMLSIYVNGVKVRQTRLPALANWDMWDYKTEVLPLHAGENTIAYKYDTCDSGNVNLDALIVGAAGEALNLALHKPVLASSSVDLASRPSNVVDGSVATGWSSALSGTHWIWADLGAVYRINHVVLNWGEAFSRTYQVQMSNDDDNWFTIYSAAPSNGEIDDLSTVGIGRYIRVHGTSFEGPGSLREFEVYGRPAVNLALCMTATASSSETMSLAPKYAVDGNIGTRWSSVFTDPQWIQVDLGAVSGIGPIVLNWETAYAKAYTIEVSNDGLTWTTIYSTTTGNGGLDGPYLLAAGRYVRMYGTQRATPWGYSLWEFEVYPPLWKIYLPICLRQYSSQ
jgi:hypothetical protein